MKLRLIDWVIDRIVGPVVVRLGCPKHYSFTSNSYFYYDNVYKCGRFRWHPGDCYIDELRRSVKKEYAIDLSK